MSRVRRRVLLPVLVLVALAAAAHWLRPAWLYLRASAPGPLAVALGDAAACEHYAGLPEGFGEQRLAGMQRVPGGEFLLGSDRGYAEERPQRRQAVAGFWMDRTEVTNAQFAAFVAATAYRSEAERQGGAVGFQPPASLDETLAPNSWWRWRAGADWRHPDGPGSDLAGRDSQPVVNVSYADALAYARWLGHELPSEAQWEYAARGGLDNTAADALARGREGRAGANAWQGFFPYLDEGRDGYRGRAPVGCYPANAYGLHDLVGNVWEWTTDPWRPDHALAAEVPASRTDTPRVIKGGSYLCAANWCVRARAAARQPQESDLAATHLGFRTVVNPP